MENAEAEAQAPQEEVPAHAEAPEVNYFFRCSFY